MTTIGAELDALVAVALGMRRCRLDLPAGLAPDERALLQWIDDEHGNMWKGADETFMVSDFDPSTSWEHGGPIIEREKICLMPPIGDSGQWVAHKKNGSYEYGPTPLIASMRAYVAAVTSQFHELRTSHKTPLA